MAKKVKNLFKKLGRNYVEGIYLAYKPAFEHGIVPLMF